MKRVFHEDWLSIYSTMNNRIKIEIIRDGAHPRAYCHASLYLWTTNGWQELYVRGMIRSDNSPESKRLEECEKIEKSLLEIAIMTLDGE